MVVGRLWDAATTFSKTNIKKLAGMIPKGAVISYGETIEVYRAQSGKVAFLMVWYRRDTFGDEWPSSSLRMVWPIGEPAQ